MSSPLMVCELLKNEWASHMHSLNSHKWTCQGLDYKQGLLDVVAGEKFDV